MTIWPFCISKASATCSTVAPCRAAIDGLDGGEFLEREHDVDRRIIGSDAFGFA